MENRLTLIELRIIGSLVEKELTTPEYYPLTLNSLKAACNQKSNRNPVLKLTEGELEDVLYQMQLKKLVQKQSLAHSRTSRYVELFNDVYQVTEKEKIILTQLFLRGPQTRGELRTRCDRMLHFDTLNEVEEVLTAMINRDTPFIRKLERQTGQKEPRYTHLFLEENELESLYPSGNTADESESDSNGTVAFLEARVETLENRVLKLEDEIAAISNKLETFS